MRRFLLLFAVVSFAALGTANAQCSKAKKAACAKKSAAAQTSDVETIAMKVALEDESIERKVCANSGKVSYFQTSKCAKSGSVSVNEVQYCTKSAKFINMAPGATAGKSCSKAEKAACAKKGKACCAGAAKAGCCAKKGAEGAKAIKASNTSAKKACSKKCSKSKACKSKAKSASADAVEARAIKVSGEK